MPENDPISDRKPFVGPVAIFIMILLFIFASELATMQLFSQYLPPMDTLSGGLLDAAVMVVLAAAPFWFLLDRLPTGEPADGSTTRSLAVTRLIQSLVSIFVVEYLVTLALMYILTGSSPLTRDLADAFLTTAICAAPIWILLIRPSHAVK